MQSQSPDDHHYFALVVGINEYASARIPNLQGCVNDAENFTDFLKGLPGIRDENIKLLLDADATHRSILETFRAHFIENNDIRVGDAIIFYFAGRGRKVFTPTICPYDERLVVEGQPIPSIPLDTLNNLFREVMAKKGDNIVCASLPGDCVS
ncbi:hypothetical protein B0H14DRAFT_2408905 [Mycena olivaceomarginata]|nr:hypothetical protein B0H14DRAFT_2408905 [Mycena olivaceomarginata]